MHWRKVHEFLELGSIELALLKLIIKMNVLIEGSCFTNFSSGGTYGAEEG